MEYKPNFKVLLHKTDVKKKDRLYFTIPKYLFRYVNNSRLFTERYSKYIARDPRYVFAYWLGGDKEGHYTLATTLSKDREGEILGFIRLISNYPLKYH